MHKPIHLETIEMLVQSIQHHVGEDGRMAQFLFGQPGDQFSWKGMGTTIYFSDLKITKAALFVRRQGPLHLKSISLQDIVSLLQNFIMDNYWYIFEDVGFVPQVVSASVSHNTKLKLADAIAQSSIFAPVDQLTLYPLATVNVESALAAGKIFLIPAASLEAHLPSNVDRSLIDPEFFPPLKDKKYKQQVPSAWLGVSAPSTLASNKQKAAILGALALTQMDRYRHQFTGRHVFGGTMSFGEKGYTYSPDTRAHTPPLGQTVTITDQDKGWLDILATKLQANERSARMEIKALEYFYRAWPLGPSERFPVLCMALDGIFGDANQATQAVIDGVRSVAGSHVDDTRLRKLMNLRAVVIHGAAPDVYDSSKYEKYYAEYASDPIRDMELVVARCLRSKIFQDTLIEHADPHAELIAQQQALGRLPKTLSSASII